MNKELLTMLAPKTQNLEKTSGNNDSITTEDINLMLSYSNLSVFCGGTGFITTINSKSVCPHCNEGIFNFTDHVREHLLKIDDFKKYKKVFRKLIDIINNIEMSALDKIGDT